MKPVRFSPSFQFSSVAQSCLTLCDPMDRSTPGLPVYHQHPELAQTHVHWVSDAIQPSHPLLSPSPPAFNLSQHQGFFQWVCSSCQVASIKSFGFNVGPSNEHPGLISSRKDWLDLLESKGLSFLYSLPLLPLFSGIDLNGCLFFCKQTFPKTGLLLVRNLDLQEIKHSTGLSQ